MALRGLFVLTACLFAGCLEFPPGDDPRGLLGPLELGSAGFIDSGALARALPETGAGTRARAFLAKCARREPVLVGFMGGSISTGAGATSSSNPYTSRFASMLTRAYPGLRVTVVNASTGATGSRYGASRAAPDMLARSPDLVVLEYAVNDFIEEEARVHATMEGLVRQCLRHSPDLAVMLLAMPKGDGLSTQAAHWTVGMHYGLPRVSYRDAVWPLVESGHASWNAFFKDDPHPNDSGHAVAARLLYEGLRRAATAAAEPPLPAPLFTDLFEFAGLMDPGDTAVAVETQGWTAFKGEDGRQSFVSDTGLSTLILRTRKREMTLGIHIQSASDTSSIRVVQDGLPDIVLRNVGLFDHTRFIKVFSDSLPGLRTVSVVHPPGHAFTIDYVLYAGEPE